MNELEYRRLDEGNFDSFYRELINEIEKGVVKYPGDFIVINERHICYRGEDGKHKSIVLPLKGTLRPVIDHFNKVTIPMFSGRPDRGEITDDDMVNFKIWLNRELDKPYMHFTGKS